MKRAARGAFFKRERIKEFRAAEKELAEQRADLQEEMNQLLDGAKAEKRAMTEEERIKFDELEQKIKDIDATLEVEERAKKLATLIPQTGKENTKALEERAFANFIRGVVEQRADVNMKLTDNGAVIPESIANKIIKKVYDICPIYQLATKYNVKGNLSIPYYDESTQSITMSYATEFSELESTSGKFLSIELKGYLAGALTKVSKSLINNSDFNLVDFVVTAMAESAAKWIEKECLKGTTDKISGLSETKQTVTTAAATAIVSDELIDLQEKIPDVYQDSAIWIMNKETRTMIRKMKDSDGNYILNKDATSRWGYTLFGKDVFTSDNMDKVAAGKTVIYYGNMSGLAVKLSEEINIEVLREKFATQHALGVVGWLELDAKVENEQKIAKLVMKAS